VLDIRFQIAIFALAGLSILLTIIALFIVKGLKAQADKPKQG